MPVDRCLTYSASLIGRRWFGTLILFGSLCVAASVAKAGQLKELYQSVANRIVCVEADSARDQEIGSGFFVAPGVVASTFHQVDAAHAITIHFADGGTTQASKIATSEESGIALLAIDGDPAAYLRLRADSPVPGEEVYTVGCPLGLGHSLTRGVISHPARKIGERRFIQTDLPINLGNSGGPLLDETGQVLGIIYGYLQSSSGINFAVPSDAVAALMRKAGINLAQPEVAALWEQAKADPDQKRKIALYERIIRHAPWLTEAYYNQGLAYSAAGDHRAAIKRYRQAIDKRPDYYQAYTNLGLSLFRLKEYQQAKDALIKAIAIQPDYATAFLDLGIVYKQGFSDNESASRAFRRFLELEPGSPEAGRVKHWLKSLSGGGPPADTD